MTKNFDPSMAMQINMSATTAKWKSLECPWYNLQEDKVSDLYN